MRPVYAGATRLTAERGAATYSSFPDGTSNTILFLVADDAKALDWTKPDDLKVDEKNPHAGVARVGGRFVFGMADSSVHTTKPTIGKATLWAAFTAAAGDILGDDW